MGAAVGSDPANAEKTGSWHGWPTKEISPLTLMSRATDEVGWGQASMLREHYGLAWPASVFDPPTWRGEPLRRRLASVPEGRASAYCARELGLVGFWRRKRWTMN
jgi:hypothetical protein